MEKQKNETGTKWTPSESEMNEMHGNARLNFHADAQEAQQDLNRRYAKLVNAFGSYKQMPDSVKEIVKQDYAEHKAKWNDNGTEQQKRFGAKEPEAAAEIQLLQEPEQIKEQAQLREDFFQKVQAQRNHQTSHKMEPEY